MAYGFRCSRCGYQETDHTDASGSDLTKEQLKEKMEGYNFSLLSCRGFTYEAKDRKDVILMYFEDPRLSRPRDISIPSWFKNGVAKLEDAWLKRFPYGHLMVGCD